MYHEVKTEISTVPGGVATRNFYVESESDLASINVNLCYPGSNAYDSAMNIWILNEAGTWIKQS
jgi:hypothetical protein